MKPIGRVLRGERQSRGITQEAAASRAGVTVEFWRYLELRKVHPPEPEMLRALCGAVGVSPTEVLRDAGYLPEDEDE